VSGRRSTCECRPQQFRQLPDPEHDSDQDRQAAAIRLLDEPRRKGGLGAIERQV